MQVLTVNSTVRFQQRTKCCFEESVIGRQRQTVLYLVVTLLLGTHLSFAQLELRGAFLASRCGCQDPADPERRVLLTAHRVLPAAAAAAAAAAASSAVMQLHYAQRAAAARSFSLRRAETRRARCRNIRSCFLRTRTKGASKSAQIQREFCAVHSIDGHT